MPVIAHALAPGESDGGVTQHGGGKPKFDGQGGAVFRLGLGARGAAADGGDESTGWSWAAIRSLRSMEPSRCEAGGRPGRPCTSTAPTSSTLPPAIRALWQGLDSYVLARPSTSMSRGDHRWQEAVGTAEARGGSWRVKSVASMKVAPRRCQDGNRRSRHCRTSPRSWPSWWRMATQRGRQPVLKRVVHGTMAHDRRGVDGMVAARRWRGRRGAGKVQIAHRAASSAMATELVEILLVEVEVAVLVAPKRKSAINPASSRVAKAQGQSRSRRSGSTRPRAISRR